MQQTLFFIPHELGGIPVFGWGWLLAGWWLGSAVWLIWTLSRHRDATAVVGFAPFFLVVSAAIMFLFPMLEAKDPQGAPLGLPVRGYGTLVLAGFVVAFLWATRRAEQRGMSGETISSLALWLFVAGFAGARLFFVIEYWDDFRRPNLGETIRAVATFTEGGLVVYGALIAALPTLAVFAWRHRVTPLELGDVVAPTLLAGLALGRIGCLMNGCCYGGVCEGDTFCIRFPHYNSVRQKSISPPYMHQLMTGRLHGFVLEADAEGHPVVRSVAPESAALAAGLRPGMRLTAINGQPVESIDRARRALITSPPDVSVDTSEFGRIAWSIGELPPRSLPVHPTQIYSALSAIAIGLVLIAAEPYLRAPGAMLALLLTLYPPLRILEEVIRVDEPGQFGTALSISQWISLGMLIVAVALWGYIYAIAKRGDGARSPTSRRWSAA